jgi:hypothetical protein
VPPQPTEASPSRHGCSGAGECWRMNPDLLGFTHRTGERLAEVGFLLELIAGVWLIAAQIPLFKFRTARTIVAGVLLAIGGALLIVAIRWGHFG